VRHKDAWALCWPHVVPSVRHVEVISLKNAWRGEALDKRFRIEAALEHHQADDNQHCSTCRVAFPCPTYWALTTVTPWKRAVEGQPVTLPLALKDIQAALAEMPAEPASTEGTKPRLPPRKAR
jgi:hypothetical protein